MGANEGTKHLAVLDIEYLKKLDESDARCPCGTIKNSVHRARNILKILERDNYQCVRCNSKLNLTIDHTHGRKFAKHNNAQKYKLSECRTICERCHVERNLFEHYHLEWSSEKIKTPSSNQINQNRKF